jgi:predicted nucleotidyltransferase
VDETQNPLPLLVIPVGTKVVLRSESQATAMSPLRPKGEVALIVSSPDDGRHSYRVRFADGAEINLRRDEFSILKHLQKGPLGVPADVLSNYNLSDYLIYRCIVGSQAYGLSRESSDVDRRGIYLPAELEWSIYGVPEQLENADTEECYWELKKFISLALKANPNILECLHSPIVEQSSEVADALLAKRSIFLSKLIYQTYNGYAMSQFKRLEQDLRATGDLKWKHAMHLIRLLLQGIAVLNHGEMSVSVADHRTALLAIRDGHESWDAVNSWRLALHREFEEAFRSTSLPDSPDYHEANRLLVWARRSMVEGDH